MLEYSFTALISILFNTPVIYSLQVPTQETILIYKRIVQLFIEFAIFFLNLRINPCFFHNFKGLFQRIFHIIFLPEVYNIKIQRSDEINTKLTQNG